MSEAVKRTALIFVLFCAVILYPAYAQIIAWYFAFAVADGVPEAIIAGALVLAAGLLSAVSFAAGRAWTGQR